MTPRFASLIAALMMGVSSPALAQEPVPTPAPNADQTPAFPEQTRVPQMDSQITLDVQPLVVGLSHPWAVAPLADGSALVTERAGALRIYYPDGRLSDPIQGIPEVDARGQGGLLDVTPAPDFEQSRMIYLSFAEKRGEGKNGTSVARARLADDGTKLEQLEVIFRQEPAWKSEMHFGSRLTFAPDGTLFVTLGERSLPEPRKLAQDLTTHLGKVVRIAPDGRVPSDNPFVGQDNVRTEIFAYGLRNVQAAVMDDQGQFWTIEHGPQGGDELNRVEAGKNYGWPVITYGQDYSGAPIGQGITQAEGMEQPIYYWDPVIAPSGAVLYDADMFSAWRGDLLIGAMKPPGLVRLRLNGDRVVGEERFDPGIGRIRDVAQAPDGALWVVTDEDRGGLYRIVPN